MVMRANSFEDIDKWIEDTLNKKRRQWWDNPPELPKDHEAIPDSLGIGVFETRQEDGSLAIFFQPEFGYYIVLGKYLEPKPDGSLFYVSQRNHGWGSPKHVDYYEHLLPAVARIMELKEEFDAVGNVNNKE